MSLHHDFPYSSVKFYCNKCKKTTIHTWNYTHFSCDECGREWDDLLLRVNVRQQQYGKILYDCILASDKPANSTKYSAETFDTLETCLEWLRTQVTRLQDAIQEP